MRIVDIRVRTIGISRYANPQPGVASQTASLVAVITDLRRHGEPIVGYGYSSVGRYGQEGLIRERFLPRLLAADPIDLMGEDGHSLDPQRAWDVMMRHEKPGGHGERCVAVGTLDMALWDIAAKAADLPLHHYLARRRGSTQPPDRVAVYASGGYPFADDDLRRLAEEVSSYARAGFTLAKIKIGSASLAEDLRRIETASECMSGPIRIAVDAMNSYEPNDALEVAEALQPLGLAWLEDICDPHDFATQSLVADLYSPPLAAGEPLFSDTEARLLARYGGLRPDRDKLIFDPVHCYGLPGYSRILDVMQHAGWPAGAFWPHGGHLFSLHVAAAFGLAGGEVTPRAFAPFQGPPRSLPVQHGTVALPNLPGIGFETHEPALRAFERLLRR